MCVFPPFFPARFSHLFVCGEPFPATKKKIPLSQTSARALFRSTANPLDSSTRSLTITLPPVGLQYFRVAHICYCVTYAQEFTWNAWGLMATLVGIGGTLPIFWPHIVGTDFFIPVLTYSIVILIVPWMALSGKRHHQTLATLGGFLFAASDLLIFINRFITPLWFGHLAIHGLYYFAQYLHTASVALYVPSQLSKKAKKN